MSNTRQVSVNVFPIFFLNSVDELSNQSNCSFDTLEGSFGFMYGRGLKNFGKSNNKASVMQCLPVNTTTNQSFIQKQ